MTELFIFNCFQQSVLEDRHESAIQQILLITTKRFFSGAKILRGLLMVRRAICFEASGPSYEL